MNTGGTVTGENFRQCPATGQKPVDLPHVVRDCGVVGRSSDSQIRTYSQIHLLCPAPKRWRLAIWVISFPLTAAGQFRICTGFPFQSSQANEASWIPTAATYSAIFQQSTPNMGHDRPAAGAGLMQGGPPSNNSFKPTPLRGAA